MNRIEVQYETCKNIKQTKFKDKLNHNIYSFCIQWHIKLHDLVLFTESILHITNSSVSYFELCTNCLCGVFKKRELLA